MERTWAVTFTSFFYFILLYALVSSFCLTFYRFNAKNQEAGRRALNGGQKEAKEYERTYSYYFYNYFCFISLYALISS